MTARILIVEDDPLAQDLVRATLAGQGHQVDVAADSFQGMRLLRDQAYDLALVDYHLPDLDGYASARLMRDLVGAGGGPKLVALTADRPGLAARAGADALFDAILTKPIEPSRLAGAVAALLAGGRLDAPAPAPSAAQAFVQDPKRERARAAAEAFWRNRGLAGCPRVAVLPAPLPEQVAALTLCFDVAEPDAADLVVVLSRAGLDAVHDLRLAAAAPLPPLVDMAGLGDVCDAAFRVNDPASWSGVAELLPAFAGRRARLRAPVRPGDLDAHLLAYLFVAGRPLRLARDPGPAPLPAAGGFREAVRPAARRLEAAGLLEVRDAGEGPWTAYDLTEAALAHLTGAVPPHAAPPGAEPPPVSEPAPLPQGPARVLLVEDLDINRQIARAMLEAAGHQVEVAGDGVEAVAAVQRSPYDLVLMDVQMPGMDGITATRHIRAFGHDAARLPIVGMTADAGPARVEGLIEAGMSAALAKPFHRDDLCAAVARWRRATPPPEPASAALDRATYDELVELIGPPQVHGLLDRLASRLAASFADDAATEDGRARLGRDAHAMVSAAGMLGFQGLSEACRVLEGAAQTGEGVVAPLTQVLAMSRAAIDAVAALKRTA